MISKKQLMEIGLGDKEATVYLVSLQLGPAAVARIARNAKINRTTGYDILEILAAKGLVNVLGEGAIKKYAAEEPQKLFNYVQNKAKETEESLERVKEILPELKSIFNQKERPKVKFYEGKDGLKQAYEDTLTSKEKMLLAYACMEPLCQVLPNFLPNYLKQRVANGIKARMLAPDTPGIKELIKTDKQNLRESRMVPKEKLNLAVEINIYDNKIMLASWEEELGVLIESEKIAQAQKQIFELAWLAAGKLNEKNNKK